MKGQRVSFYLFFDLRRDQTAGAATVRKIAVTRCHLIATGCTLRYICPMAA